MQWIKCVTHGSREEKLVAARVIKIFKHQGLLDGGDRKYNRKSTERRTIDWEPSFSGSSAAEWYTSLDFHTRQSPGFKSGAYNHLLPCSGSKFKPVRSLCDTLWNEANQRDRTNGAGNHESVCLPKGTSGYTHQIWNLETASCGSRGKCTILLQSYRRTKALNLLFDVPSIFDYISYRPHREDPDVWKSLSHARRPTFLHANHEWHI
jgi:hypothetical protein